MAEVDMVSAKRVFNTLISYMDHEGLKYQKDEKELFVKSNFRGDDLPVEILISIDAERKVIRLLSKLPCDMPEDKRVDGAIAACVASKNLVNGSFEYDITTGNIYFKLTTSYMGGSILDEKLFEYIIFVSVNTIDDYNDKFFMIAKGMMNIQQFIQQGNA